MPILRPHSELSHLENDPCFDKLRLRVPCLDPASDRRIYSLGCDTEDVILNTNDTPLLCGEDSSWRVTQTPRSQALRVPYMPTLLAGATWMWWMRVYSWPNTGNDYYLNSVWLMSTMSFGSYWRLVGYCTDYSATPYGAPRRLMSRPLHVDVPVFGTVILPTDQWVHCTWTWPALGDAEDSYLYQDGILDSVVSVGRSNYTNDWTYMYLGPLDLALYSGGDAALKDFRVYYSALSAAEIAAIYAHSLEYHQSTMGLGLLDGLSIPTERCAPSITLTRDYHVRI